MSVKNYQKSNNKRRKSCQLCFVIIFIFFFINLQSQEYRALYGSIYAGSLAATNNPAAIVNLPYTIDFTPLAFQLKYTTNSLKVKNASYLPSWNKTVGGLNNGTYERKLIANLDMRMFSTRIRLNCNSAISFGVSGRAYLSANTSSQNWQDTILLVREFMKVNINNTPIAATGRGNGWAEYYGTYARTTKIFQNGILNTGITLKLINGIAGIYVNASDVGIKSGTVNNLPGYYLSDGKLDYGYSANIDVLDTATTFGYGLKGFFRKTNSTIGLSIGAEYLVSGNGEIENGHAFKIGVALLDLGTSSFKYSEFSRNAILDKPNISDSLIDFKFKEIVDAASFADSLQTVAGSINTPIGKFKLLHPARLVINADKHVKGNFFVNADLTIPIAGLLGKKQLYTKEMNFLNVSIRYETKGFGLYLPASLNSQMNFWIGGAVRTGPLLLGFHNLANIISKNKIVNGGAYMALTFRIKTKKTFNCDAEDMEAQRILSRQLKQLACPPKVQ